jgi:hypothetical protein
VAVVMVVVVVVVVRVLLCTAAAAGAMVIMGVTLGATYHARVSAWRAAAAEWPGAAPPATAAAVLVALVGGPVCFWPRAEGCPTYSSWPCKPAGRLVPQGAAGVQPAGPRGPHQCGHTGHQDAGAAVVSQARRTTRGRAAGGV